MEIYTEQAAVHAAMKAMDCAKTFDELTLTLYCSTHNVGWLSDVKACAHAERVALAVAAVVQRPTAGGES